MEPVILVTGIVVVGGAAFAAVVASRHNRVAAEAGAGSPAKRRPKPAEVTAFDEEETAAIQAEMPSVLAECGLPTALAAGKFDEATGPFALRALGQVAQARLRAGRTRQAAQTCTKMIGLSRHSCLAWHVLAQAYRAEGDAELAGECLDSALASLARPEADPFAAAWARAMPQGQGGPSPEARFYAVQMAIHWEQAARALQRIQRRLPEGEDAGQGWAKVPDLVEQLAEIHRAMAAMSVPAGLEQTHAAALEVTAPYDGPVAGQAHLLDDMEARAVLRAAVERSLADMTACTALFAAWVAR